MGLNVVIRHFLFRLPAAEPSYDVSQIFGGWWPVPTGTASSLRGLRLTQERSNSAGRPPQPATAIYPLSNETNYFYRKPQGQHYMCCSCRPKEYGFEKRASHEVGNPPELLQQAVKYT